jgi:hypothetical protein
VGIHNANSWKKGKRIPVIGGSPWNTLGGNSENFIRPRTPRRACPLYSHGNVGGRRRCAADMRCTRMGAVEWGSPSEYPTRHFTIRSDQGDGKRRNGIGTALSHS